MHIHLADLHVGDTARVLGFNPGNPAYIERLLAMGLVPDTEFMVRRVAPLGDPIEIKFHNFSLCIRKKEGEVLRLEPIKKD